MADLRSDLFAHLQKMELAFFTATKTGAIQSRLANDVAGVRTVLTDTATSILQNSVTVTAAFVSMVILSWQLTVLTRDRHAAVRVDPAAGRQAAPAARAQDAGVAVGDDRDHRGGAQRLGHPAVQGVQPGRLRGRALSRGQPQPDPAPGRAGHDRSCVLRHGADVLRDHAGADLSRRGLHAQQRHVADRRDAHRVHDAAGPAADAAAAAHAGVARRADVARAVPPAVRVPRPRARDHRAARRCGAQPQGPARRDRVPRRALPLPRAAQPVGRVHAATGSARAAYASSGPSPHPSRAGRSTVSRCGSSPVSSPRSSARRARARRP